MSRWACLLPVNREPSTLEPLGPYFSGPDPDQIVGCLRPEDARVFPCEAGKTILRLATEALWPQTAYDFSDTEGRRLR